MHFPLSFMRIREGFCLRSFLRLRFCSEFRFFYLTIIFIAALLKYQFLNVNAGHFTARGLFHSGPWSRVVAEGHQRKCVWGLGAVGGVGHCQWGWAGVTVRAGQQPCRTIPVFHVALGGKKLSTAVQGHSSIHYTADSYIKLNGYFECLSPTFFSRSESLSCLNCFCIPFSGLSVHTSKLKNPQIHLQNPQVFKTFGPFFINE